MSETTGHGLPRMVRPGNLFLRIFWGVFFAIGFAGTVFLIYQSVEQYLRYEVNTVIKINRVFEMPFPTLTFCSENNVSEMNFQPCLFMMNPKMCITKELTDKTFTKKCIQVNHAENNQMLANAIGEGKLNGYFFYFYIPFGLSIEFSVTNNDARVVPDEVREKLNPGHETLISLSKTDQTALGPPYSDCNDTKNYNLASCIDSCFNKKVSEFCGCNYPIVCGSGTNYQSLDKSCSEFITDSKNRLNCAKECRAECNKVSFPFMRQDTEVNIKPVEFKTIKSNIAQKFNITGMSDDDIRKRINKFWIYFGKMEITEITQSPSMSISDLIGNVGGLLGKLKLIYKNEFLSDI